MKHAIAILALAIAAGAWGQADHAVQPAPAASMLIPALPDLHLSNIVWLYDPFTKKTLAKCQLLHPLGKQEAYNCKLQPGAKLSDLVNVWLKLAEGK